MVLLTRSCCFFVLLLTGLLAAAQPAEAQDEGGSAHPLSDRQALEAFFDQAISEALERDPIAGGTIAVVKDGALLFAKGYGYADLAAQRPVDAKRTLFRVGSLAKLFVGTAVLQLVEQGKLDLDTDVNRYLTAFQLPATYPEPITLRHLLTHTAGVGERLIGDDFARRNETIRPLAQYLPDLMPARVRPPGQVASYSNWGASLAGYIVEEVSGLPFADYIEQEILAPLGMTRSTFLEPVPAPLAEELAVGYLHEEGAFQPQDFEMVGEDAPAGALSSTASDMARFMIAQLQLGRFGDARILSEESAALMQRRQFGGHPGLPGMAISFGESGLDGRRLLQHSGAISFFHAELILLPQEGVGLFVAFNGPGEAASAVRNAFLDRYFPVPAPQAVVPPADFEARSARYLGPYRSNRLAFTRVEKAMRTIEFTIHGTGRGTLFLGDLLSDPDNPDEGIELVEIAPNLFREVDGPLRVAFIEDTKGEISQMLVGGSMPSYHRIAWHETLHALVLTAVLCSLIFVVAGGHAAWRLLRPGAGSEENPGPALRLRAARGLTLGFCAANVTFAAGLAVMLATQEDYFRYPPGLETLLALPVIAAVLTLAAAGLLVLAWLKRQGRLRARLGGSILVLSSALFLWVLDLWNLLGWQL